MATARSRARDASPRGEAARGGVVDIQRMRMITAMAEIARERGVGGTTVAHIVARSGVSRRTFYELFRDREDCLLAAFDLAVQRAGARVAPACEPAGGWRERMRAGLGVLLEFLEDEPALATLCVVDALGAGPRVLARRARVVEGLIDAVDAGAREGRGERRPQRLVAEGVVGAVLSVLHARLMRGETAFADLRGPLTAIVVLPYMGGAAAEREASRPVVERHRTVSSPEDPLRDLDMRLTYRTVQVLLAIAGRPDASNRQVADDSGVSDQGQISRLLARLEHLGLISNSGEGPARGEPNAWRLTHTGHQIQRTIDRSGVATGDPPPTRPVSRQGAEA